MQVLYLQVYICSVGQTEDVTQFGVGLIKNVPEDPASADARFNIRFCQMVFLCKASIMRTATWIIKANQLNIIWLIIKHTVFFSWLAIGGYVGLFGPGRERARKT